jgi:putative oxidoreductase
MNTGLLVLRLVIGLLLVGHGSQKLFGLFGGPGLSGAGGFFHSLGFRPGKAMAIVAGTSEVGAGVLLVLGLLTPLASAAVIGTLVVAGSVHWAGGLWGQNGGYELPLLYATAAAALAFTGPGAYSVDKALGLDGLAGNGWGLAAVVVGAVSGLAVVARGRRILAAGADAQPVAAAQSVAAAQTVTEEKVSA